MEENKNKQASSAPVQEEQYEEIDLMELLRKLLKNWKTIFKWCCIAGVAGLVVAFSIPKEYTVDSKLAPEIVSRTNSSLSSLASLAGVNLSSMSTSDAVYPELYPEIVSSTPFVVELFSVPVEIETRREGKVSTDLYTYLLDYTRSPWWSAVISAPFKALGWVMSLIRGGDDEEEVKGYSSLDPSALTSEQEQIAKAIRESISVQVDSKNSMITVSVTAQDPLVATDLSKEVIARIEDYVTDYRTEKSRKDLDYYEQLYEEARAEYYDAQQRYAKYVDANQNVVLQSVLTERERLNNEMQLAYNLYNTCAQQVQMAKAKVQQETPVCVVVEPPTLPTKASKPSKMLTLVAFVFLGACLSAVWVLFGKDWVASFKSGMEK